MTHGRAEQLDQFAPPGATGRVPPDAVMLAEFTIGGPSDRQLAEQAINEQLTETRVSDAIRDYEVQEARETPPVPPVPEIEHSPIDEAQQTGESRLLGGEMRIRNPWAEDQ